MTKSEIAAIAKKHEVPSVFYRQSLSKPMLIRSVLSFWHGLIDHTIIAKAAGGSDPREQEYREKLASLEQALGVTWEEAKEAIYLKGMSTQ